MSAAFTLSPEGTSILASGLMDDDALFHLAMTATAPPDGMPIELLDASLDAMGILSAYIEGYGSRVSWSPTTRPGVWRCEVSHG